MLYHSTSVVTWNSEAAKKTTFTLPPGSKTLQFKNTYFCFLLSIQGGFGQLFGDFVVTGYGDGGSNRYHVAKLQCGSDVNIAIGDEGTQSITLTNTSTTTAQCVMLDLIWLNSDLKSGVITVKFETASTETRTKVSFENAFPDARYSVCTTWVESKKDINTFYPIYVEDKTQNGFTVVTARKVTGQSLIDWVAVKIK